jgi:nitrite reductase/ring-hydroxylating ferredoxin subunit
MRVTMAEKQGKDFIVMNRLIGAIAFLLCTSVACKKDTINNNDDFFTPVRVYLSINLNLPLYSPLTVAQGYVYEAGGNKGIIIYRTIFDEYVAYDRTCPHEPTKACSMVSVDSSGTFFRCGQYNPTWEVCCDSKFDPLNGAATSLPAKRSLRQYYVRQTGNTLLVTNTP